MKRTVRTVVLVVALLVAAATGSAGALGATPTASTPEAGPTSSPFAQDGGADNVTNTTRNATQNASFGATVSSFMQASAADTESEVEEGMFDARFNRSNASERARLVRARASTIRDRVEELREERRRLLSGDDVSVQARAEAARLAVRARGLSNSINGVQRKAERSGVSLDSVDLDELRRNAANVTGRQVAAVVTDLIDRDNGARGEQGPPGDHGPPEDRGEGQGPPTARGNGSVDTDETESDAPGNSGTRGEGAERGNPGGSPDASADNGNDEKTNNGDDEEDAGDDDDREDGSSGGGNSNGGGNNANGK
jgi:hypothetical protein